MNVVKVSLVPESDTSVLTTALHLTTSSHVIKSVFCYGDICGAVIFSADFKLGLQVANWKTGHYADTDCWTEMASFLMLWCYRGLTFHTAATAKNVCTSKRGHNATWRREHYSFREQFVHGNSRLRSEPFISPSL
jgi:hypothetical protein